MSGGGGGGGGGRKGRKARRAAAGGAHGPSVPRQLAKVVPWRTWAEWAVVMAHLLNVPEQRRVRVLASVTTRRREQSDVGLPASAQDALDVVAVWRARGRVPHGVECAAMLAEAAVRAAGGASEMEQRMLLCTTVVRFVNGLVDGLQVGGHAVPVAVLAERLALPRLLVDVRHDATHNAVPSLPVLAMAVDHVRTWLCEHYMGVQLARIVQHNAKAATAGAERARSAASSEAYAAFCLAFDGDAEEGDEDEAKDTDTGEPSDRLYPDGPVSVERAAAAIAALVDDGRLLGDDAASTLAARARFRPVVGALLGEFGPSLAHDMVVELLDAFVSADGNAARQQSAAYWIAALLGVPDDEAPPLAAVVPPTPLVALTDASNRLPTRAMADLLAQLASGLANECSGELRRLSQLIALHRDADESGEEDDDGVEADCASENASDDESASDDAEVRLFMAPVKCDPWSPVDEWPATCPIGALPGAPLPPLTLLTRHVELVDVLSSSAARKRAAETEAAAAQARSDDDTGAEALHASLASPPLKRAKKQQYSIGALF